MTNLSRKALAAGILLAGVLGVAQASVVTFEPLTSRRAGPAGDGTTYLEGGLTFTSSVVNPQALYHWGRRDPVNADPTGATLFQNLPLESLSVTQTGGGAFDLYSFDLEDIYNSGAAGVIPFSYTDGSGTHSSSLTLDKKVGLQTFVFGYTGVTSFSLVQNAPYFQIDNIVTTPIPEPETYALMMAGLLAVAGAVRRRGGQARA